MTEEEFRILNIGDADAAGELLSSIFQEDPACRFMFRSNRVRDRWFTPVMTVETRFVIGYGTATGLWEPASRQLVGVALWYLPHRRFPPPWHRMLIPSLSLFPLQYRLLTASRIAKLHKFYVSLLPKSCRYLYLEGLAVHPNHRDRGLGKQLLEWGKTYAQEHQCPLLLHCWEPMVAFYQRQGFTLLADGRLRGLDAHCHVMSWQPTLS